MCLEKANESVYYEEANERLYFEKQMEVFFCYAQLRLSVVRGLPDTVLVRQSVCMQQIMLTHLVTSVYSSY